LVATQQNYMPDFADINVQFNRSAGEGFGADRMTGKFMYWRKPVDDPRVTDRGYVVIGSATPQELVRQMDKGFQPLRQFGEFQLWNATENWRVSTEPYRRIFQRRDGLLVFPVAQILEHQWHILPPYAGITFPQIQGLDGPETRVLCAECRRVFSSQELLMKHRSVAHRQTANNTALGESIASAVSKMNEPLVGVMGPIGEALQRQSAALEQMMQLMALNQDQQNQLRAMFEARVAYGGHEGVPPAPPAAPEVGEQDKPLPASAIDPNPEPTSGRTARGQKTEGT
jgi:hypothetical protein